MYWSSPKLIKRVLLQKVAFVACCILLLLEFKTKWMDLRVFQLHSYTATQLCVVARRGTSWHVVASAAQLAQDYTCQGASLGSVSPEAFGSTDGECCAERKCEVGKNIGKSTKSCGLFVLKA